MSPDAFISDHHPLPALPIGGRGRLQRHFQTLSNEFKRDWAREVQPLADRAGSGRQLIWCQGQRRREVHDRSLIVREVSRLVQYRNVAI